MSSLEVSKFGRFTPPQNHRPSTHPAFTPLSPPLVLCSPHRIWNYERSATDRAERLLPLPSLQFLARFKAQLIPSFFAQLSCLFFTHMEATEGCEIHHSFQIEPMLFTPISTLHFFSIIYIYQVKIKQHPVAKKLSPPPS